MQAEHAGASARDVLLVGVLPVIVAAFAYPAGNRKTMELADGRLDTWQRILAMVIASLPFWLVLSAVGAVHAGAPGATQLAQSLVVAVIERAAGHGALLRRDRAGAGATRCGSPRSRRRSPARSSSPRAGGGPAGRRAAVAAGLGGDRADRRRHRLDVLRDR